MEWHSVADSLSEYLQNGNLDACIKHVTEILAQDDNRLAQEAIRGEIANSASEITRAIDNFKRKHPELRAIYIEMNGFYINPDRWYFEIFGFDTHLNDPLEIALEKPTFSNPSSITLTGMENLQQLYTLKTKTDTSMVDLLVL